MPLDYPLRSPYISYVMNGKRHGYNVSDWNPAMGLKSVICDLMLKLDTITETVKQSNDIAILELMTTEV